MRGCDTAHDTENAAHSIDLTLDSVCPILAAPRLASIDQQCLSNPIIR